MSNAELQYLNGVTSAIQTQLDGKSPTSHTHAASEITSGILDIARIPTADDGEVNASEVVLANDSRLSDARSPVMVVLQRVVAASASPGSYTSGSPNDVILNTVVGPWWSGGSLNPSTGVVTLPAGEYILKLRGQLQFYGAESQREGQAYLYDITSAGEVSPAGPRMIGGDESVTTSVRAHTSYRSTVHLNIGSTHTYKLQVEVTDTVSTGAVSVTRSQVIEEVEIIKIG